MASETFHAAKRRLVNPNPFGGESESDPTVEPNAIDKEVIVLGNSKRKDLSTLIRKAEPPFGG